MIEAPIDPAAARRRRRVLVAVAGCVAAVVAIVVLAVVLSENVVYWRSVSEAVQGRADQGSDRLRLGGQVVPDSVTDTPTGVRFEITDGKATAVVEHRGDPPDLFEDCVPVVAEGSWGAGRAFESDRILIRHGNEYSPPRVDRERSGCSA